MIMMMNITKKSSTRLFFALLDRCHSNAETAGLRLLLHTKQKSGEEQRTCYSRRQVANSYLQTPSSFHFEILDHNSLL